MLPCINAKKMYALDPNYIQSYSLPLLKEGFCQDVEGVHFYYETTVTFNRRYWTLSQAISSIPALVADVFKPIIRHCVPSSGFIIRYVVEYHQDVAYPHVHFQIITESALPPIIQQGIHQRLCRRYGRSDWWQTGNEDKYHESSGMLWSEYLKKDVEKNEHNGLRHYYEYYF